MAEGFPGEELGGGKRLAQTSRDKPILDAEYRELIRGCFGEDLAEATVLPGSPARVEWRLPLLGSVQVNSPRVQQFLEGFRTKLNAARVAVRNLANSPEREGQVFLSAETYKQLGGRVPKCVALPGGGAQLNKYDAQQFVEVLKKTIYTCVPLMQAPEEHLKESSGRLCFTGWGILRPFLAEQQMAPPLNLAFNPDGKGEEAEVVLSWNDDVSYADGFVLRRYDEGRSSWEEVARIPEGITSHRLPFGGERHMAQYRMESFGPLGAVTSPILEVNVKRPDATPKEAELRPQKLVAPAEQAGFMEADYQRAEQERFKKQLADKDEALRKAQEAAALAAARAAAEEAARRSAEEAARKAAEEAARKAAEDAARQAAAAAGDAEARRLAQMVPPAPHLAVERPAAAAGAKPQGLQLRWTLEPLMAFYPPFAEKGWTVEVQQRYRDQANWRTIGEVDSAAGRLAHAESDLYRDASFQARVKRGEKTSPWSTCAWSGIPKPPALWPWVVFPLLLLIILGALMWFLMRPSDIEERWKAVEQSYAACDKPLADSKAIDHYLKEYQGFQKDARLSPAKQNTAKQRVAELEKFKTLQGALAALMGKVDQEKSPTLEKAVELRGECERFLEEKKGELSADQRGALEGRIAQLKAVEEVAKLNASLQPMKEENARLQANMKPLQDDLAKLKAETQPLRDESAKLKKEIEEKSGELATLKAEAQPMKEELAKLKAEAAPLKAENARLKQELTEKDAQIARLKAEIERLKAELEKYTKPTAEFAALETEFKAETNDGQVLPKPMIAKYQPKYQPYLNRTDLNLMDQLTAKLRVSQLGRAASSVEVQRIAGAWSTWWDVAGGLGKKNTGPMNIEASGNTATATYEFEPFDRKGAKIQGRITASLSPDGKEMRGKWEQGTGKQPGEFGSFKFKLKVADEKTPTKDQLEGEWWLGLEGQGGKMGGGWGGTRK